MTHSVVIHALMVSWYPKRRTGNPTGDGMMDLDPCRSSCVDEVVEESHEASCMVKKPLGQMTHSVVICGLHGYWWFDGVLKPLEKSWLTCWIPLNLEDVLMCNPWCMVMKTWWMKNPWWRPWCPCKGHCLYDGMLKAPTHMWWHLDTLIYIW